MTIFRSRFADAASPVHTVTQHFFAALEHRLDDIVLIDGPTGRSMSARQLVDQVKSLAGGLKSRGLGPGNALGLMAPNGPEYVVIFHAAAWAGITVTTINPTYTAHETHHQLRDAGVDILVTVPAFAETAREAMEGTKASELITIGEAAGATPLSALMASPLAEQVPVDLDRHVLVLPYSSGTTGLPKGVMLSHRNLVTNIEQSLPHFDIRRGDVTPVFLPFFHIYGLMALMILYIQAGGAVATMPRFELELFLRLAQDHKSRGLYIVPPVAIALAKHPMVDDFDLRSVEFINCAAAPLGAEVGRAMAERLGCTVVQAWGMTELSPVGTLTPLDDVKSGSVGVLVGSTEARIVDTSSGRDLGPGRDGEILVRGPQVMLGYHNKPAATEATLTPDGWLRTGDVGVFDEDGHLFIHDRVKELIKYKGFQVAPAEIEAALLTSDNIADAGVIGVPDDEAGEVPVAFIVSARGAALSEEEVRAHLEGLLSHYKQVRGVHFVEEIPKSASGKILRRVLREMLTG